MLTTPRHAYTRMLLAAEPTGTKAPPAENAPTVLEASDIKVTFRLGGGLFDGPPLVIRAVDGIDLTLEAGPDHRHRRRDPAPASRRSGGR